MEQTHDTELEKAYAALFHKYQDRGDQLRKVMMERDAARAELDKLNVPLGIYEQYTKAIGAAEELERLVNSNWLAFPSKAKTKVAMILMRAKHLRDEAARIEKEAADAQTRT